MKRKMFLGLCITVLLAAVALILYACVIYPFFNPPIDTSDIPSCVR